MGIYTQGFIMFSEIEGAELCFVVEHIKILVKFIVMNQLGAYLFLTVSKRTKIRVLTFVDIIGVMGTKLLLISLILI